MSFSYYMQYEKGSIGRVFTARIDHTEDLLSELSTLAKGENIESAVFMLLGAASDMVIISYERFRFRFCFCA